MLDTWKTLTNELAIYGIKLINARECSVYDKGQYINTTIDKVSGSVKKRLFNNGKVFEDELKDMLCVIQQEQPFGTKEI